MEEIQNCIDYIIPVSYTHLCESLEAKLDEKSIDLDEVKGIGIGLPGPVLGHKASYKSCNKQWFSFCNKHCNYMHDN